MRNIIVAALLGAGIAQAGAQDDPYLWLEDRTGPQALEWVKKESGRTRAAITGDPRFESYLDTMLSIYVGSGPISVGSAIGDHYYSFEQDDRNPLGRWRRTTLENYSAGRPSWEMMIDFDELSAREGVNWVFSTAWCEKPEFRICSIEMSPDGGDATAVREFDTGTRQFLADGFNVPASKSNFNYVDFDTAIIASALGPDEVTSAGYPRVVKLWERGTPISQAETVFEVGRDDLAARTYRLEDPHTGREMILLKREIDFYAAEWFAYTPGQPLRPVPFPPYMDKWTLFDGHFVLTAAKDWAAPNGLQVKAGGLYAFDYNRWLDTGEQAGYAELLAPRERFTVDHLSNTRNRLFVGAYENVRGQVIVIDKLAEGGWSQPRRLPVPDNGAVWVLANSVGTDVTVAIDNLTVPPVYFWSSDEGETLMRIDNPFHSMRYVTEQFEATSKDGTRVPYFVARPARLSGPVPTLLYGYGGFQVLQVPWYSSAREKLWLSQGNAWVLANIRGGGEFGPLWHQAALRENRQVAFDDFAAVAADLVARGITTPAQLGIQGGSNGGLLVGASLTQRPDLFGAAISEVPLLDMMRYTLLPPGGSWIAEYGDPLKPGDAAFIAKYSPYQNVLADRDYPATLFMTSTADDRVHPAHARKMAAKMIGLGHDAFFHEYAEGGHGGSGDLRRQAEWVALEYMFLQRELEGAQRSAPLEVDRGLLLSALRPGPLPDRCGMPDAADLGAGDQKTRLRLARIMSMRAMCR